MRRRRRQRKRRPAGRGGLERGCHPPTRAQLCRRLAQQPAQTAGPRSPGKRLCRTAGGRGGAWERGREGKAPSSSSLDLLLPCVRGRLPRSPDTSSRRTSAGQLRGGAIWQRQSIKGHNYSRRLVQGLESRALRNHDSRVDSAPCSALAQRRLQGSRSSSQDHPHTPSKQPCEAAGTASPDSPD